MFYYVTISTYYTVDSLKPVNVTCAQCISLRTAWRAFDADD